MKVQVDISIEIRLIYLRIFGLFCYEKSLGKEKRYDLKEKVKQQRSDSFINVVYIVLYKTAKRSLFTFFTKILIKF